MNFYTPEYDKKVPFWLVLILAAALGLLAGPAILLGAVFRLALKRVGGSRLIWAFLVLLGVAGAWIMVVYAGYPQAFQMMMIAIPPLSCWDWPTGLLFLGHYVLPLWTRSLLVTPLCAALWELFLPKSMDKQLLDQDRVEQAMQDRATMRAKQASRHVPAQIGGQAVIGVVVKSLNNSRA